MLPTFYGCIRLLFESKYDKSRDDALVFKRMVLLFKPHNGAY